MKLLKTIEKIIQEAEEQYNSACESCVTVEELDRLEKHYKDSLKLMKLYKSKGACAYRKFILQMHPL
jgi:DNA invertase Pin-like site-specific DNA recombinase